MNNKAIAKVLKERLARVNQDYLNYSNYAVEELEIRQSEIGSIAFELAEQMSLSDSTFDRSEFMKLCGLSD